MKFQETQYLLDVAHYCSALVFPLQKLLCWKFRHFLLRNKALVYFTYLLEIVYLFSIIFRTSITSTVVNRHIKHSVIRPEGYLIETCKCAQNAKPNSLCLFCQTLTQRQYGYSAFLWRENNIHRVATVKHLTKFTPLLTPHYIKLFTKCANCILFNLIWFIVYIIVYFIV